MKKIIFVFLLFVTAVGLFASPNKVKFTDDGFIDIDGVYFYLAWMDQKWRQHFASSKHDDPVWKMRKNSSTEMVFNINPPDGTPGKVALKITPGKNKNQYIFSIDAKFEGKCNPNYFGITTSRLTVADFGGLNYTINGKKYTFEKQFKKYTLWSKNFNTFEFPSMSGKATLTGSTHMHLQDNRYWNSKFYGLRIGTIPYKNFSSAKLKLTITITENDRSLGNINRPPFKMKADKKWAKFDNALDVIPGSALDFSGRIAAPAGNLGFLKIKGDKFYFEKAPDTPVKFVGTNLVGTSQVLDSKEQCEILAKRLAAFGFNCIRIHHHDNEICDRKDTRKLDPVLIDKFDYLIHCLKKNGLYITTDVYVSRRGITKLELPKYGPISGLAEYKALFWVDDDVFQNWKDAARNFFTHVNPYTKTALINDPVLVNLSLVNEGNPQCWWSASRISAKIYNERLAEFRKIKGNEKATMDDFCSYLAIKRYNEMKKFVIEELGCKVPLTDQNFQHWHSTAWERANYDYVDNHSYWDHPKFVRKQWSLPIAPDNVNVLKEISNVPSKLFPTRILGVPFTVTEYDYANPNIHRLHGPALFASYAAFQDWDGIFQFAYSHSRTRLFDTQVAGHNFDLSCSPGKSLAYRLGAKIFLYGKVRPAQTTIALVPLKRTDKINWSSAANSLGFVAKLGSHVGKENAKYDLKLDNAFFKKNPISKINKTGKLPKGTIGRNGKFFYTQQLRFDAANGTFRLKTDGAEVISLQAKGKLAGKRLSVNSVDEESTIAIIPHDTDSLSTAKRIVLFHLTDVQATDRFYANDSMSVMNSWGKAPFLVKKSTAKITLDLKKGDWKIYSLALDGSRKGEIPYTVRDGKIELSLNTADQMVCEIVRK